MLVLRACLLYASRALRLLCVCVLGGVRRHSTSCCLFNELFARYSPARGGLAGHHGFPVIYIPQRGVQWKQGVVIDMY